MSVCMTAQRGETAEMQAVRPAGVDPPGSPQGRRVCSATRGAK